jgi:hypothetical protein
MAILHHRAAEGQLVLAPAAGSVVLGYIRAAMDAASQRIPLLSRSDPPSL